jgi:hypothetical protein
MFLKNLKSKSSLIIYISGSQLRGAPFSFEGEKRETRHIFILYTHIALSYFYFSIIIYLYLINKNVLLGGVIHFVLRIRNPKKFGNPLIYIYMYIYVHIVREI